jgi:hypothetical protein
VRSWGIKPGGRTLIRMRSRRCRRSARPAGGGAPPPPSSAGRRRTTSTLLRRHTAAARASRANGFALSGCASGDPGHHDPAGRQPTELDRRSVLTCEDGCRRLTVVGIARRRLTACRRPRRCMGAERGGGPPGGGLACCRHAPVPCGRLADNAPVTPRYGGATALPVAITPVYGHSWWFAIAPLAAPGHRPFRGARYHACGLDDRHGDFARAADTRL